MEVLKLKSRLKTAQRGYKLLKEKRDGLMKKFMEIIRDAKHLRDTLEEKLSGTLKDFFIDTAFFTEKEIFQIFAWPNCQLVLSLEKENIMSVLVPKFKAEIKGDFKCYSPLSTPPVLDKTMKKFWQALKLMISLAQIEHSARLLSFEIEKTRRRVNALEYVIIPGFEQTIKYIESKLEEQERADKIVKMKMKELVS